MASTHEKTDEKSPEAKSSQEGPPPALTDDELPEFSDPPALKGAELAGLSSSSSPPAFSQHAQQDFSNVGELSIANVSPMTAHVSTDRVC
jgi:hypothetical protein